MKTVKFFSLVMAGSLLMVSGVFARNIEKTEADVKSAENSVRIQLAQNLSVLSVEPGTEVYVYFQVSSKSGFEVLEVSGLNKDVAREVKRTLNAEPIQAAAILDGKYLVKVRFTDYN